MKHLFFLVPDIKSARGIVHELLQVGIKKDRIHMVGEPNTVKKANIPLANIFQTTDIVHAIKRGFILGVVYSIAIYILFYIVFLANDIHISLLGTFAIVVFGMGFGFWSSGMIAIGTHHPVLDKYTNYVKEGHYIMIVDVPKERERELIQRVTRHHPGTRIASRTIH